MLRRAEAVGLVSPHSIIFKALYTERKLLRHHVNEVSISAIVIRAMEEGVSVKDGGLIVAGLSRILARKLRYLLDECNDIVHTICSKGGDRKKGLRQPSSKGITLGLDLENLYIDDQMISPEEFVILPEEGNAGDVGMQAEDVSFGAFDNMSYIEEARLSAGDITGVSVSTGTEVTQIPLEEHRKKRRRVVEDSELEFDPRVFRENLRNTRDIVQGDGMLDIKDELASRLVIAPEILSKLVCREMVQRESIEGVRDATMVESYADISFGDAQVSESQASEDVGVESHLDVEKLPRRFVFGEVVAGCSRLEKSNSFLSLLGLLGAGSVRAHQKQPYSDIECEVV